MIGPTQTRKQTKGGHMSANGIDGFKGALFTPGDGGYDDARTIFNTMIDRRPAYIAQCTEIQAAASAATRAATAGA
jgi:hypothetical protein